MPEGNPGFWAAVELRQPVKAEHDSEPQAQDQQTDIAVFSEEFQQHPSERIAETMGGEIKNG